MQVSFLRNKATFRNGQESRVKGQESRVETRLIASVQGSRVKSYWLFLPLPTPSSPFPIPHSPFPINVSHDSA